MKKARESGLFHWIYLRSMRLPRHRAASIDHFSGTFSQYDWPMTLAHLIVAAAFLAPAPPPAPCLEGDLMTDGKAALEAAFAAARSASHAGPQDVKITDQAIVHLPAGMVFVPKAEAIRLLALTGRGPTRETVGMIFPAGEWKSWHLVAQYFPAGYVKDDDADWSADEILEGFKTVEVQVNRQKRQIGETQTQIVGWIEPPVYDRASHWLLWAIAFRSKSPAAHPEMTYKVYFLGREGYVDMRLVADAGALETPKRAVRKLLGAFEFVPGKRYSDFTSSTDRVAPHGLRELIGGSRKRRVSTP